MRVGLFVTCLTDTFFPRVAVAVVKTLRHLGCDVGFPEEQTCCGQPGYTAGLPREAERLLVRMARVFDDYDYVVSPSGSCTAMVKLHGADLCRDDAERASVRALAAKCWEFTSFLDDVLAVDWHALGVRRTDAHTFHYPCHLRGLVDPSRAEKAAARLGDDYRAAEGFDACCGFGGTFATTCPEISAGMLRTKLRGIEATGAKLLVCNEGGCGLQIGGGLHRRESSIRIRHVAELIAEAQGWDLERLEAVV